MEARHVVYVLSSSSRPDLFRYVGCTANPRGRLDNHTRQLTLVGIWMYWERLGGNDITMREVASFSSKDEGRDAEAAWINALAGQHLLNRESWPFAQRNSGVPNQMQYLYKELLSRGTAKARRGCGNEASEFIYLSKVLATQFSGLSINVVGKSLDAGLQVCGRLGFADSLPVLHSAICIDTEYEGHMPDCLRASL